MLVKSFMVSTFLLNVCILFWKLEVKCGYQITMADILSASRGTNYLKIAHN